ncbi:MAG: family 20 glycosylhydrolase [Muribaculaceae bacterium]|nr:family 20 glycosylhydrolase [Muribaculaceae bacterium]
MKLSCFIMISALGAVTAVSAAAQTTVTWSTGGNVTGSDGKPAYVQRFTVTGDLDFDRLAFNQFARRMKTVNPADTLIEIVPGYYCIASPRFKAAGDSVTVEIETYGSLRSICYTPDGVHIVKNGVAAPAEFIREDITATPSMWVSPWGEDVMPYGDKIYDRNEELMAGGNASIGFYDVIPSYKSVDMMSEPPAKVRQFVFKPFETAGNGRWQAVINNGQVMIQCAKADLPLALRRLAAAGVATGAVVPGAVIEDWPDFPYRGLMIDISRNYQTPAELERVLRLMGRYGLNVLHFHFADDEAWRLEIPGMPELTEVGARRGYTLDEADYMAQIFAGNGDPNTGEGTANGYYTRDEFIKLLKLADSLGIAVLPEVESPGHARAAIKAMERRLRLTGDDTYRLIDPADTSVYTSAQSFHDNVMNPAIPGPVRFMTHVARELQKMYNEAGVAMPGLHIGGDEVAKGAWTGSPIAQAYMAERGITDERQLHWIFVNELLAELNALGIPVSGWQEIAVGHDDEYNNAVRPHIYSVDCWSTLGEQNSVTAQSARAGYPTVLSNVEHFYLDMCYSPHPYERGLSWGGYVDEFDALHGYPRELCAVEPEAFENVIGVSGQLFAETIRSAQGFEDLLLPKMLGLAERGWNCDSTYTDPQFNAVIYQRELPLWQADGYSYHVRQPGIKVVDGKVAMNHAFPASAACEIRYTIDGTTPVKSSPLYTRPIDIPASGEVRAVAFVGGKPSVATILYTDKK